MAQEMRTQNHLSFSGDEVQDNIDRGQRILQSSQLYIGEEGSLPADDLYYWSLLEEAHAEYRQRFTAQEQLGGGDIFSSALDRALARIPFAKQLELRRSNCQGKYILEQVQDP